MAKSKANYVPSKNIKSITIQRGKKTTEVKNNNILDGAYVKKGVKFGKGGNSNEDYYENLMVYVQGKGQIYQGTSMKKAIEKANLYMSKNPNSEIAIVDEKYGDEYDLDGNLKDEYAKGGSMSQTPTNKEVYDNGDVIDTMPSDIGGSNMSEDSIIEYNGKTYLVSTNLEENRVISPNRKATIYEEEYRTGGVAGSKHVDVTKGYRLPHGYKAVKGDDKNRNYSKGKPKVRVDAGWRLPKGYEVVESAYNMKYEDGGMMAKGGNVDYAWLIKYHEGKDQILSNEVVIVEESNETRALMKKAKMGQVITHDDADINGYAISYKKVPLPKGKKKDEFGGRYGYEDGGNMNDCYCYEIGGL